MKLAFYKANKGTLLDKLTNCLSDSLGYSHVELVFSDGMFFSSSPRDGGVRFKRIAQDDHWTFLPINLSYDDERIVRLFCNEQIGKKYDWLGVLRFIFPTHPEQNHWFCSEICVAALQQVKMFIHLKPWLVSPNSLYLLETA